MNSREKGKRGELELARALREYGYDCRRGQQFSGKNGDADVTGLPYIHIEVKRVESLNIDKAMDQSGKDAYAESLKVGHTMFPAVFHRRNGKEWKVTMQLKDWIQLYREYEAGKDVQDESGQFNWETDTRS